MLQQIRAEQPVTGKGSKGNYVAGLVLVPTRELAKQVADSIKSYAVHFNGDITWKVIIIMLLLYL